MNTKVSGGRAATENPPEDDVVATRQRQVTYWVDERDGKFPLAWWKIAPLALLAGLALVAVLTLVLVPMYENQIVDSARSDLEAAGIDTALLSIDADYRDLQITGFLLDGTSEADVATALDDTSGVRDLDLDLLPAPAPESESEPEQTADTEAAPAPLGSTEVTAEVTADGIVLSGQVTSEAQRQALVEAAEARFGSGNVVDELEVTGLEPAVEGADDRVEVLAEAIAEFPDGAIGSLQLTDASLGFIGTVANQDDADDMNSPIDAAGLANSSDVTVATSAIEEEIDQLQAEFEALEAEIRENVVFATGSDVLDDTAAATLDKVVTLMDQYQLPVVEVSGHTDDQGDADTNLQLSEARAAAVVTYLVDAGVDAERIRSRGAGETDPIASNDTAEGRAENRRVELAALASF